MYNQGATMHKIAHTHKIRLFSWCVLSFERLSDSTSLFPIQLCRQHMRRLLKELVREIFTLPDQYCSAQYKASPPSGPSHVLICPLKTQVHFIALWAVVTKRKTSSVSVENGCSYRVSSLKKKKKRKKKGCNTALPKPRFRVLKRLPVQAGKTFPLLQLYGLAEMDSNLISKDA